MSSLGTLFGPARAVIHNRYALLPAATLPVSPIGGWEKTRCHLAISPSLGARFTQFMALMNADGRCAGNTGHSVYAFYVVEGNASILLGDRRHRLEPGSLVIVPPGQDLELNSANAPCRVCVVRRRLAAPLKSPPVCVHERDLRGQEMPDAAGIKVQSWVSETPGWGMTMDLWTLSPGATLPNVLSEAMEAGWFILSGEGICRLAGDWHPVDKWDSIWVGAHCPHWFAAIGRAPTSMVVCREHSREV